jgi:hypothetical protein
MKYIILTFFCIFSAGVCADSNEKFINLAKKTSSTYSGSAQVDENNSEKVAFETLIDDQKVLLRVSVSKLNTAAYTVINSGANLAKKTFKKFKSLPNPPMVIPGNLNITVDTNSLCSSLGTTASGSDTSCTGKDCTVKQLIISKCNATNCWKEDSSTDRLFSTGIAEEFDLLEKVDISNCLTNNNEGVRHELNFSESESLKGGTVNYQVIVVNDIKE